MVYNDPVNGVLSNSLNFYGFPCTINPCRKTGGHKETLVNHEPEARRSIENVVNCLISRKREIHKNIWFLMQSFILSLNSS